MPAAYPTASARSLRLPLIVAGALLLGACDMIQHRLGLQDPAKLEATLDGEGRAVGAGCRQSGRAIEDCYALYERLPKASIFAGWRDMNDYMIANKLDTVAPRHGAADGAGAGKK